MLTVKANQRSLYRQISDQLLGKRKIPFSAMDHEIAHGRDITWDLRAKEAPAFIKESWHGASWIAEVIATGTRDGKPFKVTHRFITSLRNTPEALLHLVRERWSLESWHWIRDTQLRGDHHRNRGNELAAPGWFRLNPGGTASRDARHRGTASTGETPANNQPIDVL